MKERDTLGRKTERNTDRRADHRQVCASGMEHNLLVIARCIFPSARKQTDNKFSETREGRRVFGQRKPYNNWNMNACQCFQQISSQAIPPIPQVGKAGEAWAEN